MAPPPGGPPEGWRRRHWRIRAGLLLLALLIAAAWAHAVRRERAGRRAWERTLRVAVVLLAREPEGLAAAGPLRARLPALAARLAAEQARHRGPGPDPFAFEAAGPVAWDRLFPLAPASEGFGDRVRHAITVWSATRGADRAAGLGPGPWDARLYLLLERPRAPGAASYAEGAGAVGGEVGLVRAWVAGDDATLALSALGHELLHCLGASDKYDPAGRAREPEGLAEPERAPRHPQRLAEWMVGEVPVAPGRGRLPAGLEELGVGPVTAREIGWLPPAP